jgi:hypothetical protein
MSGVIRISSSPGPPLAQDLVAGREGDQVGEALERDRIAVVDELGDGFVETGEMGHVDSEHQVAGVGGDDAAGHDGGQVTREQQGHSRDVVGNRDAAERQSAPVEDVRVAPRCRTPR